MKTIFEKSQRGQRAYSLPKEDPAFANYRPDPLLLRKKAIPLPEISELDLTRHYSGLARRNIGIDTTPIFLGSCTMKLNPRVNELCAALPGFSRIHPLAPPELAQGCLEVLCLLKERLCRICGMTDGTTAPCAGAQGEFVGIKMIRAYHLERGDRKRKEVVIPDDAHGTNPATAAMAGFRAVTVRSGSDGEIDLEHLKEVVSDKTAALMLTNPNTLGLFSTKIEEISKILHERGALLYYDGANLNAILNIVRPGEMGFDVMHINLHKTFSTPHGGGGPGAGPVLCNDKLKKFLPLPKIEKKNERYTLQWDCPESIGEIAPFYGNFAICLRAYLYILLHGDYGLRRIAEIAVLNSNYLKKKLEKKFTIPFKNPCMHEFVLQTIPYLEKGVRAYDIAKRLLDYGIHAPTVYFPLIIKECMLIEPTESESKETLDQFVGALEKIVEEIQTEPELVKSAPHTTPVSRLDEVRAAKEPVLSHLYRS